MQQITTAEIRAGVDVFYREKPADDIDLIQAVRASMLEYGLHDKVANAFDNNHYIIDAIGKPSTVQRFLLNRYWSLQLMSSANPSIEQRYCLIPDGEVSDWLRLFKESVLPFAVQNELPIVIS